MPQLHPALSHRRTIVPGLLAAAVLCAASWGCGSSSSSSSETPAEWADSLCSSLVTWQNSIKSAGSKFSSGNLSKATLQDAVSEVSDADSKLEDGLSALGKPPKEGAEEARNTVSQLSQSLKADAEKIDSTVSNVSSLSDVSSAVSAVTSTVTAMGQQVSSATQQLKEVAGDDTWKNAFSDSQSCQSLKR